MIQWVVTSSILIIVVAALRYLLRGKVSLRLQYALWALVLLRLLVPVSFGETGLSVGNLTQRAAETEAAQTVSELAQLELPRMSYSAAYSEVAREYAERGIDIAEMPLEEYAETVDYEILSRMGGGWSVRDILKAAWISGIAAAGLALLFSNILFAVKLRRSRRELVVDGCALPVYVSELIDTPCLFGLFRPAVYVTPAVAENETVLRHSVEHETTHFRHGDHVWAILRGICLALHWYNPLVWWAASLSRRDAELACDEATIKRLGESERTEYGRTLIGLTCQKRAALLLTATTMTGSKRGIKERIMLIAKKPKTAAYTLVAVLLIATLAVGCTFTGANEDDENNPWLWAQAVVPEQMTENDGIDTKLLAMILNELDEEDFSLNSAFTGGTGMLTVNYAEQQYPFIIGENSDVVTLEFNGAFWDIASSELYEFVGGLVGDTVVGGLEIAMATDELLSQLPSYDEIDASTDEYGNRLLLTATGALSDLNIFRLVWDEDAEALSEGELLYHAEELTQETPLVLSVSFPGVLPTVGLSYTDAAGQVQTYYIVMSGEDGSILLSEPFANVPWGEADVEQWQNEVPLIGFSVEADGGYEDIGQQWAEAFVSQYVDAASPDNPLYSADAAVLSCTLYAESLPTTPKTLIFNMRFVCDAADAGAFERWYAGWAGPMSDEAYPQYDGWMEFGWFVVLDETAGGEWICTDAGTGGYGGWGYLNYDEAGEVDFRMEQTLAAGEGLPENLLRVLPFVDWAAFDADNWNALYALLDAHCLTEGQVYGPEETRMWSDVYPDDQAYRNLYVMLAALNSDGAYTEGLAEILKKQRDYDPELFDACLQNLTQAQQDIINMLIEL